MKVSACIITYNQEDYIRECLDGALSQVVDFDYEIVIGEDKSTDSTLAICEEYAAKYPKLIRLLKRKDNLGMMGNWIETIKACDGKYIAMCEGDDYWTDPLKLQKQVDFLDENEEYVACFHRVKIQKGDQFTDDYIEERYNKIASERIGKKELLEIGNFMHTVSVVFRNNRNHNYPIGFQYSPVGDYLLHIYNSQYGYIKRIDSISAVYRYGVGTYSGLSESVMRFNMIRYLSCLVSFLSEDEDKKIVLERIKKLVELQIEFEKELLKPKQLGYKEIFSQLFKRIRL